MGLDAVGGLGMRRGRKSLKKSYGKLVSNTRVWYR